MKRILFLFIAAFTILNASKQELTVSISPQKYFVQKIVKDKFDINVMVKPGASPHTYEPKSSQMKSLSNSKIYFYTGVSFENAWLDKFKLSAKNTIFVDTAVGIEKLAMEAHSHEGEEHNEHKDEAKHDHENEALDPHIWLDPILVKIQAKNIYDAIVKIDSQNSDFYKTNYEEFLKELDLINNELETILKPYENRAFMVFHPSWGYFAKRYNLEQISVEVEGKEPKPNELVELIKDAKIHDIKIVFVSPQFSQKTAKTISSSINAKVVSIDALDENWASSILSTAKEIANSYTK
ncbi:MAG: zinc ABC transporter substrate-binding protein [Aliarcobacter sp.]|nr:zinc ABC transporter substrate-binding protein [Aliarcobacter sp.]MBP6713816.1 zinc ABC transporter substrate-binding protein [Aliarcobacter sp.]